MACVNFSLCCVSEERVQVVFAGNSHGLGELLFGKELVALRF
jgi:hypothetical protein